MLPQRCTKLPAILQYVQTKYTAVYSVQFFGSVSAVPKDVLCFSTDRWSWAELSLIDNQQNTYPARRVANLRPLHVLLPWSNQMRISIFSHWKRAPLRLTSLTMRTHIHSGKALPNHLRPCAPLQTERKVTYIYFAFRLNLSIRSVVHTSHFVRTIFFSIFFKKQSKLPLPSKVPFCSEPTQQA